MNEHMGCRLVCTCVCVCMCAHVHRWSEPICVAPFPRGRKTSARNVSACWRILGNLWGVIYLWSSAFCSSLLSPPLPVILSTVTLHHQQVVEQTAVHPYGMLLSHKRGCLPWIFRELTLSTKDTQTVMALIMFLKWQNYKNGQQSTSCQGLRRGAEREEGVL